MAIIKKYADGQITTGTPVQLLSSYGTFVVDTNPNSTYFKITEFKDTFTGGKNGFLIEGSPHLMESTEIKIQIIDVDGNPVYYEPGNGVPEYYEGLSKVVAVYVYQDTPIGSAKITVLGELKTYIDEFGNTQLIPDEWKGVYNVKWEKEFKINRLLANEDKVRFYKRPVVNITEIVKPIYSNIVTTKTQKGLLYGTALAPSVGAPLTNYTSPTSYLLTTTDDTFWTASVVGTNLTFDDITYSPLVNSIVNSREIIVQPPYIELNDPRGSAYNNLVANLGEIGYTASFNYVEGVDNLKTALTGSFAKIELTDLTTFVGDCNRVKIFRKSQSSISDYEFVQEIKLESNELLVDLETTTKNAEYYGTFDSTTYKNYWVTSSNNLTTTFNQNYLFDSLKLDGSAQTPYYFYTTKSLSITEGSEYSLEFDVRISQNVSSNYYVRAFISGSKTSNGVTTQVEQNITTLNSSNSLLQKQTSLDNIIAEQIDNAKLYFEVFGTGWYIANVSFRVAQETAFSPDEITFIQSVPRSLPEETFLYRFEFYQGDNKVIPVLVEATKTFNGGNLQTIRKGLRLLPSATGFQFDSGSNPVPPTIITITEQKTLLTGSVHYTSQSFDFFGNDLSSSYTGSGQQFPGLLHGIGTNNVYMTVADFTGSRTDIDVQLVRLTGECEGFSDTINIYKILDGFGGVNHIIRPYRGTQIRNSSTASLEIQAVRIDGINDVLLSAQAIKNWGNIQLHIISRSKEGDEKFVNLAYATASGFVPGLTTGSLGSKQINYNATFNRDSIDFRRIVYLIPSSSAAGGPAYAVSSSVLASIVLEDLQDGLDAGKVTFNTDNFTINPRTDTLFTPQFAFGTASFLTRTPDSAVVTASFQIFPSMSLNKDYVPEYWMYYTTQRVDNTIFVTAKDDNKLVIPSASLGTYVGSPLSQSKNLTLTFTYTEPWTSASVSFDKTFTITPQGKPGDESIVFEITPATVNLKANAKGIVGSYSSSITNIRVKQGSRYLAFTGSVGNQESHGTFHIAQESIISSSITGGLVYFDNAYTESLIISGAYNMNQLSASLTFPLRIHPYYTSSIYTQSIVQNFTKVLDGAPQIEVIISPLAPTLNADEVGYVDAAGYLPANTTIKLREGQDYLTYTTQSTLPGTWRFVSISGSNIQTSSLSSSSFDTATLNFRRFDWPYTTASVFYNIVAYPYSLGPGHLYTSSVFNRTQVITKSSKVPAARTVNLSATYTTVNFDKDGVVTSPLDPIVLTATAHNTTGSVWYQFYKDDIDQTGIQSDNFYEVPGGDATGPGENATWKVQIRDGTNASTGLVRAEGSLTIAGIKGGADAYKIVSTNDNTSIAADLWTTSFTGSGQKIITYKGLEELSNVTTATYNAANDVYDYLGNYIGNLGFSSASIFSKSTWITPAASKFSTNPATIGDITAWDSPATHSSGQIVYKVDFENGRQVQYVTQSISVQFTPPAPYVATLSNENTSGVYKVSGQFSLSNTGTYVRVYRGGTELTNLSSWGTSKTDAYGNVGYPNQCKVTIESFSSHLSLGGGLTVGSFVTGAPAYLTNLAGWTTPETYSTGEIVFKIDCEGRQTLYKTQSLSLQYEGATGPGIVMRGEWNSATNYSGSVETKNYRRDAVIYGTSPVTYYAAISGSGPTTYNKQGTLVGAHAPTAGTDNAYWQYLGQEEFFVAAKIAIFEESFVKNTVNIGNNSGSAYANIVLAGGREDPYMAIGQYSSIGYDQVGIWLGIYNDGTGPTTYKPRFSMKNSSGTNYMRWTGTGLELSGDLNIVAGGSGNASTQAYAQAQASGSGAAALTSAANIAALTASAAYQGAVQHAVDLANGAYPGTFISSNFIYSPVVAGVGGYFSDKFKVGSGGITLDGTNKKIFIGTGNYNNADTSFYVDNTNQFSLGNKLTFDGNNLNIAGSITANTGYLGGVDGWIIAPGVIKNNIETLFLDASNNSIYIKTSTGAPPDLIIKKGALSEIGGSTVNFTPPSITDSNPALDSSNSGTYLTSEKVYNGGAGYGTSINLSAGTGTYNDADIDFGGGSSAITPEFGAWSGNIGVEFGVDIFTSNDPSGTPLVTIYGGYMSAYSYGGYGSATMSYTTNTTLTLDGGATYYAYTWYRQTGYVYSGSVTVIVYETPPTIQMAKLSNIIELTSDGVQVASGTDKYFKVQRSSDTSIATVTSKGWYSLTGDGTNSTLQIKGTSGGTAIDVAAGAGQLDMNNNAITDVSTLNWNSNNGRLTNSPGFSTVYLNNLGGAGGGTIRGLEISLSNWYIGRNTSARRFKFDIKNWEPEFNLLDAIQQVPVRNYYWEVDKHLEDPVKQVGLIAEELEAAGFNEWVDYAWFPKDPENPEGEREYLTSGIGKGELVFILWKAVQQLTQKVKDLENKLNS